MGGFKSYSRTETVVGDFTVVSSIRAYPNDAGGVGPDEEFVLLQQGLQLQGMLDITQEQIEKLGKRK